MVGVGVVGVEGEVGLRVCWGWGGGGVVGLGVW